MRPALPGPADGTSPQKVQELAVSTTSCGFTATQSCKNKVQQRSMTRSGQQSLERLFLGLTEDSMIQATLSAGQSRIGFKRARDIIAPAHLAGSSRRSQTAHPGNDPRRSLRDSTTQASEEHTPLQRGLAASDENRRPVPHAGLPQMALPPGRVRGKYPDAARLHSLPMFRKDSATDSGWVVGSFDAAAPWTHSWNMQKPAAQPKPREDTMRAFTLWSAA